MAGKIANGIVYGFCVAAIAIVVAVIIAEILLLRLPCEDRKITVGVFSINMDQNCGADKIGRNP